MYEDFGGKFEKEQYNDYWNKKRDLKNFPRINSKFNKQITTRLDLDGVNVPACCKATKNILPTTTTIFPFKNTNNFSEIQFEISLWPPPNYP